MGIIWPELIHQIIITKIDLMTGMSGIITGLASVERKYSERWVIIMVGLNKLSG